MTVKYRDLEDAFDFVSCGQMYEHQAFLNSETGEIYWHSEMTDDFDELPEDIDNEKYVEIPNKNELDLGKHLVMNFAYQYLPNEVDKIDSIFRKKGAYSQFKSLLENKGLLDKWYEFESEAEDKALREWCKLNEIKLID